MGVYVDTTKLHGAVPAPQLPNPPNILSSLLARCRETEEACQYPKSPSNSPNLEYIFQTISTVPNAEVDTPYWGALDP